MSSRTVRSPVMAFIGVSTAKSSIHLTFPRWATILGLSRDTIRGIDFALNDDPLRYRGAVSRIRRDPNIAGALITAHKINIYRSCRDLFDRIDPLSDSLGEVSCLYKRAGQFCARAVDPWTCGPALRAFIPENHFLETGAEALIFGAGGSGVSIAWHLANRIAMNARPSVIHVTDNDPGRLAHLRNLKQGWRAATVRCHSVSEAADNDRLLAKLPPGSLVVNATGMGKDLPGAPVSEDAVFPENGLVWDLNYRGALTFLAYARAAAESRHLTIEDGWRYFLHGWAQVISDVFAIEIPPEGELFAKLVAAARR